MSGTDFYYENMVELAEKLAGLAPGGEPKRVYFGNSGAEAAARSYFGTDAGSLTRDQAARLAAILPSPSRWRVISRGATVRQTRALARTRQVVRDKLNFCVQ